MKLLFDQNLSVRLVDRLQDLFPDSMHTALLGFERESDAVVWEYAREHGFTVVSKDSDLIQISLARGLPPSIVWIRLGNCSTSDIEAVIRRNASRIRDLASDTEGGILELY